MPKLKSEKIIKYLIEKGCVEVKSRSKYRQFKRPGRDDFYFVGKNGALRAGKNASNSVSLSHLVKV